MENLDKILKIYGITEASLMWDVEFMSVTRFRDNVVEDGYVDNGRCDIITRKLEEPFEYKNHKILGYTLYDKYLYGREIETSKKFALTLYYEELHNTI